MSDEELHNLAEVVRQVQIERAISTGDHDAIIAAGATRIGASAGISIVGQGTGGGSGKY